MTAARQHGAADFIALVNASSARDRRRPRAQPDANLDAHVYYPVAGGVHPKAMTEGPAPISP